MVVHTVSVRARRARVDPATVVAGTSGCDALDLDLDEEWDGMDVRVAVSRGEDRWEAAWDGEPVELPADALSEPRSWLSVSVLGSAPGRRLETLSCRRGIWVAEGGR